MIAIITPAQVFENIEFTDCINSRNQHLTFISDVIRNLWRISGFSEKANTGSPTRSSVIC